MLLPTSGPPSPFPRWGSRTGSSESHGLPIATLLPIQRLAMVSVVVSIPMRKMFAEVRKMFVNARHAEQDVRERQASRNF